MFLIELKGSVHETVNHDYHFFDQIRFLASTHHNLCMQATGTLCKSYVAVFFVNRVFNVKILPHFHVWCNLP